MRVSALSRILLSAAGLLGAMCLGNSSALAQAHSSHGAGATSEACPSDDSGLKLPAGFCATIFADGIGHARHMVVAPDGVVYVNTWSGGYYGNDKPHAGGFLVALQDKTGAGKADVNERFGETVQSGGAGGTGIGLYKGSIYAESNDRDRALFAARPDRSCRKVPRETIVSGLPLGGDHPMHPFIIDSEGAMLRRRRHRDQRLPAEKSDPGIAGRGSLHGAGDARRHLAVRREQDGPEIFAGRTIRDRNPQRRRLRRSTATGDRIFVTQHGRDQLHTNWPKLYKPEQEATLPAEEVLLLKAGGDYGWPECYYDGVQRKLVLAPEYGGDGGKKVGVCADKIAPVAAFPAHWAPNAMVHYDKKEFPARYRNGVFIAFHGSWNRAPYPQGGYNVVFQPLAGDHASGGCEIFADGFAGAEKSPDGAAHRPSGLAVGPDGALYVSDDIRGRIYRIVYRGGAGSEAVKHTACPSLSAPAGNIVKKEAKPPEGTHPDAGAAAAENPPLPEGVTQDMVALGNRIYHGEVGGGTCTGCHGMAGTGSPLGPDLTDGKWMWSDGSFTGILKTITDGVMQPKRYRSAMPPMGGAQLTSEQVSAVAAYVWTLSHHAKTSSSTAIPAGLVVPGE